MAFGEGMPAIRKESGENPDERYAEWFREKGFSPADSSKPETLVNAYQALTNEDRSRVEAHHDASWVNPEPEDPFQGAPLGLEERMKKLSEGSK